VLRTFGNINPRTVSQPSTSDSQQSAGFPCITDTENTGKNGRILNVWKRKAAEKARKERRRQVLSEELDYRKLEGVYEQSIEILG